LESEYLTPTGAGTSEYEWAWRIPAASFPAILAALGGHPGDDPIELVRRWSKANPAATRA
jgi:hypothetical protein